MDKEIKTEIIKALALGSLVTTITAVHSCVVDDAKDKQIKEQIRQEVKEQLQNKGN